MALENQTIWQSDNVWPFEYWTSLLFTSPLYQTADTQFPGSSQNGTFTSPVFRSWPDYQTNACKLNTRLVCYSNVCNSGKIWQIKFPFGEREGDRLVLGERVKITQAALYKKLVRMTEIPKDFICCSILTGRCLHHSAPLEHFFGVRMCASNKRVCTHHHSLHFCK